MIITRQYLTILEVPSIPGGCMAERKEVFDYIGGFDNSFTRWAIETLKLVQKTWCLGFTNYTIPHSYVTHLFKDKQTYDVTYKGIDINSIMFLGYLIDNEDEISIMLELMKHPDFAEAYLHVIRCSDYWNRLVDIRSKKTRTFVDYVNKYKSLVFTGLGLDH